VAAPGLFLAALLLIPAGMTGSAVTAILCLTASNFFLELVLGPAWAVPMDVGGTSSGTVTAVMNMVGAVGASISPLVFGFLVERGSWVAPFFVTAAVLASGSDADRRAWSTIRRQPRARRYERMSSRCLSGRWPSRSGCSVRPAPVPGPR